MSSRNCEVNDDWSDIIMTGFLRSTAKSFVNFLELAKVKQKIRLLFINTVYTCPNLQIEEKTKTNKSHKKKKKNLKKKKKKKKKPHM